MMMKLLVAFVVLAHASQDSLHVDVYEGVESVLLPCQTSIHRMLEEVKVVWSRFDLNPAIIRQHPDKDDRSVQNQHYSSRTSMQSTRGFFTDDFSLTLNKPRLCDSGTYSCSIHVGEHVTRREVRLQVKEPYTFPVGAWVPLGLLVLVLFLVLALLWETTITVFRVEVNEGEWFVKLPYKTHVQMPEDVTVEWSRCAPEPMKVHVYHHVSVHLVKQDKIYHGRTSMKKQPLKTGDLSLTLRNPCYRDSGTYVCTVHKDREVLAQKVIRLRVKVIQEEVEIREWTETFTLPFKTTAELPEDATVEWRRSHPNDMTVHVYQRGHHQSDKQDEYYHGHTEMSSDPLRSKDLSVTIHNSGYRDRGTYICTVHRDGDILAKKVLQVRIKVSTVHVEVDTLAKTAKLPLKIAANLPEDATVEWSCFNANVARVSHVSYDLIKIHVYQNGQDQPDEQDIFYRGRTTMKKNPLQTGDVSLTLSNPTLKDSATYICTVSVNGDSVWERIVYLKVKARPFVF